MTYQDNDPNQPTYRRSEISDTGWGLPALLGAAVLVVLALLLFMRTDEGPGPNRQTGIEQNRPVTAPGNTTTPSPAPTTPPATPTK
jgi:hypothetical protein